MPVLAALQVKADREAATKHVTDLQDEDSEAAKMASQLRAAERAEARAEARRKSASNMSKDRPARLVSQERTGLSYKELLSPLCCCL